jgi:hypothetical protein
LSDFTESQLLGGVIKDRVIGIGKAVALFVVTKQIKAIFVNFLRIGVLFESIGGSAFTNDEVHVGIVAWVSRFIHDFAILLSIFVLFRQLLGQKLNSKGLGELGALHSYCPILQCLIVDDLVSFAST